MRALRYDDIVEFSPPLTIFRHHREIYGNYVILAYINIAYLSSIHPIAAASLMLFGK